MFSNANALRVVKFVASGVVGLGTSKVVSGIIKNHVTPETLIDKVTITAASWVISGIATTATKKYSDETIDEGVKAVKNIVKEFKTSAQLGRINKGESTFETEGLDQARFRKDEGGKWVAISDEDYESNQGITKEKPVEV